MNKIIKLTIGICLIIISSGLLINKQQLNNRSLGDKLGINNKITKESLKKNNPIFGTGWINSILQTSNGDIYVGGSKLGGEKGDNQNHSLYISHDQGDSWEEIKGYGFDTIRSTVNVIYQTKNGDIYVGGEFLGNSKTSSISGSASLCKFNSKRKTWNIINGINGVQDNDDSFSLTFAYHKYSQINSILETDTGKIFIVGSFLGTWTEKPENKGSSEIFSSESSDTTENKWDYNTNPVDGKLILSNGGTINTIIQSSYDKTIYIGGYHLGVDHYNTLYSSNNDGKTWKAIKGVSDNNGKNFVFDNPHSSKQNLSMVSSILIAKTVMFMLVDKA